MRGKANFSNGYIWFKRITPAYAGKSPTHHLERLESKDHPRLCGEKRVREQRFHDVLGSPPPMRGKGSKWCVGRNQQRITPAYAGKSC